MTIWLLLCLTTLNYRSKQYITMTEEKEYKIDRGTYSDGTPQQKGKHECRYHPVSRGYEFHWGIVQCRHCYAYMAAMDRDDYYD